MERQKGMSLLLIFSLAFNFTFLGIWLYHVVYVRPLLAEKQTQQAQWQPRQEGVLAAGGWEALRLRPDQRRRVQAMRGGLRTKLAGPMQNAREAREEFAVLLQDPDTDPRELRAAQHKIAVGQESVRRLVMDHVMGLREVLDEDQQREFGRMLRGRHGPGLGRRRRMRQGGQGRRESRRDEDTMPQWGVESL